MDIVQPQFDLSAFNCPFCKTYAHMDWSRRINITYRFMVYTATCAKCDTASIWRTQLHETNNALLETQMIYPDVSVSVIPENDMPHDVRADFEEAKAVFHKSPKASAALLRLALQKLLKHLGEPGENINKDIGSLVEKGTLNVGVQRAADTVRITGNNAVHPGVMNDDDIDYIAAKMFDLINFIVKKTITEPREIEEIYNSTPEGARNAITRRDAAH